MEHEMKQAALAFIRENPVCHMATVENAEPFGRVMWTVQAEDDFTLWYTSAASSQKMRQLEKNPSVCLTIYESGKDARIFGRAEPVTDRETKDRLWKEDWRRYFPQGKEDPEYQLVRVTPSRVEYRDLKKSGMRTLSVL
jgi:general stress protein 26